MYGDTLPESARKTAEDYLATRGMKKIPRIRAVRRLGCTMQSRITRIGQMVFG